MGILTRRKILKVAAVTSGVSLVGGESNAGVNKVDIQEEPRSFTGRIKRLDLKYETQLKNFVCEIEIIGNEDSIILYAAEHRLQTLLEMAFAAKVTVEVAYIEKGIRLINAIKVSQDLQK